jgi:hypothetical protein
VKAARYQSAVSHHTSFAEKVEMFSRVKELKRGNSSWEKNQRRICDNLGIVHGPSGSRFRAVCGSEQGPWKPGGDWHNGTTGAGIWVCSCQKRTTAHEAFSRVKSKELALGLRQANSTTGFFPFGDLFWPTVAAHLLMILFNLLFLWP